MFTLLEDNLNDLKVLRRDSRIDNRGSFQKLFCGETFENILKGGKIMQVNFSNTSLKGTIRGMHFKKKNDEKKIVSCVKGSILDVVVDLRKDSKNFLKVFYFNLSDLNNHSLLIPEGFAHGFQSLVDEVFVIYLHTKKYEPENEDGFFVEDSLLKIKWPKKITKISKKDSKLKSVKEVLHL